MSDSIKRVVGILLALIIGVVVWNQASKNSPQTSRDVSSHAAAPPSPATYLSLDFNWYKSASDAIMLINATIKNSAPYDVKDIEIKCDHAGRSGTVIDHNTRTIYDIVPAGKTKTFKNFNMGFIHSQAESSSCQITRAAMH